MPRRTCLTSLFVAMAALSFPSMAAEAPSLSVSSQHSAHAAGLSPSETAERIAAHLVAQGSVAPEFTDLGRMDALLALYDVTGKQKYLDFVKANFRDRIDPEKLDPLSNALSSIDFELFERTRDPKDIASFERRGRRDRTDTLRAFDGAISFYRDEYAVLKQSDGAIHLTREMAPIFVDHLQEYAPRMAKTGWLTGDKEFYEEAARQILLFHAALYDPGTGLWNHGRGWYGTARDVTAVRWARAQGWVLRALIETMTYLPPKSPEFKQVSEILRDEANALTRYQDKDGFWHQVVDRPDSYPETSGTGLISYYFARAVRQGFLPRKGFEEASKKAFDALAKHRISSSGVVYGASISTAPQQSVERYLTRVTPVDDPHGVLAAIYAAAGQLLLEGKGQVPPPSMQAK